MQGYILALDQGTTSSRAILFDAAGQIKTKAQYPLRQIYPAPGWVEHDPMDILSTQLMAAAQAFEKSGCSPTDICAIGITNQRETTIVWDKDTGLPVMNAIVWQCRRTAAACDRLKAEGLGDYIQSVTGLIPDAYFSGTKIAWILDHVPGARQRAEAGKLLCGTVDSWLIWNLTGEHVSDLSNCSRTMLFDIHKLQWDERLCKQLGIPMGMLPRPVGNSQVYGRLRPGIRGLEALAGVPVCGAAGDQCPRDLVRWVQPETPIDDPNVKRPNPIKRKADPSMYDVSGCNRVGKRVANEIISVLEEITDLKDEAVFEHKVIDMELPLRRVTMQDYDHAVREIEYYIEKNKDKVAYTFEDSARLNVHIGTIRRFAEQQTRNTVTAETHIIRFGDISISTSPFELFLDYGNIIKARSLSEQSFIIQLSCGGLGYLPTEKAEKGGHYSAYVSSGDVGHEGGDILVRRTLDEINKMFK